MRAVRLSTDGPKNPQQLSFHQVQTDLLVESNIDPCQELLVTGLVPDANSRNSTGRQHSQKHYSAPNHFANQWQSENSPMVASRPIGVGRAVARSYAHVGGGDGVDGASSASSRSRTSERPVYTVPCLVICSFAFLLLLNILHCILCHSGNIFMVIDSFSCEFNFDDFIFKNKIMV